jgi:hypothetical protein
MPELAPFGGFQFGGSFVTPVPRQNYITRVTAHRFPAVS